MRKWEIWKNHFSKFDGKRKLGTKDYEACKKLHARKETKAEANRVAREMRAQGIICCVRKRNA